MAFRSSSHQLMIEKGRHIGIPREIRFCIHCRYEIECEFHFLLKCPLYNNLRQQFIPNKYWEHPNNHKFKSVKTIRNLSMFLYYAFKLRNESLS